LDFCKTALSNFIPSNPIMDETLKCLLAFGKGACNSLSKTGEIITHPIQTGKMIGKLSLSFLNLVNDILPDDTLIPTEKELNRIEKRATEFAQVSDALYEQLAKANHLQYCQWAGEIIADIVTQHYAFKAAGKAVSASELVAKAAERIAKGERIFESFGPIGKETAQVIGLSVENGNEIVREGIKSASNKKGGQLFFEEVKDEVKEFAKLRIDFSRDDIPHIFRNKEGHLLDTAINRKLLIETANIENFLGIDQYGTKWYARTLSNGKQVWIMVRNNLIRNGGLNEIPKIFDSKTGLSRNL
jgi:hypothetical protein